MSNSVDWVYASGSTWVSFDPMAQQMLEHLWRKEYAATWIASQSFRGPVFVDITEMTALYGSYAYTIARRKC
ncbi:hypothetical protein BDF20DRAFT_882341 [Mycotypha africana]|uniref:uncharacterized protein n=1 Tax=Mycotypha africana TaxID=64632 RepID=UPI0023019C06|nr:uncharacterized protein BDF20DRAFT_882341 [Mycotypha africana]KAI8973431.1 hypothetical protein BDF20DRAFT_882341 [Mycotypha africana]